MWVRCYGPHRENFEKIVEDRFSVPLKGTERSANRFSVTKIVTRVPKIDTERCANYDPSFFLSEINQNSDTPKGRCVHVERLYRLV